MASSKVDWQIGLKSVVSRASTILSSGQFSDCSFLVGTEDKTETMYAHRLILAMASPVFEAMFYGGMAEKDGEPVKILDVQPKAFEVLLRYIYTDEIELKSFDQICEVCYAAKKYMIPPLVEICTNYIWRDLHPANVCRAFEFAKLFEEPELTEKCMNIIILKAEEVIQDISFEEVDLSTLKTILTEDILYVEEGRLWEACLRWAKQECIRKGLEVTPSNQRVSFNDVFNLFRFLTMTPNEFANGPAKSELLTKEESYSLLMNISCPGVSELPPNFSSNTSPRRPPSPRRPYSSIFAERRQTTCPLPRSMENNFSEVFLCNLIGEFRNAFQNEQTFDCRMSFTVDHPILVTGVILPTQLRPHAQSEILRNYRELRYASGSALPSNSYPELIYAFIEDSRGSRLTYTHFSGIVNWESTMEVIFNTPIQTIPGALYTIVVVLNKTGKYPFYTTLHRSYEFGLEFCFSSHCRSNIFKTLIFKKHLP